jgi:transposase
MMPFILGEDRFQIDLLPNTLNDYVSEDNPVRVIDAYVDSLDLENLGFRVFDGTNPGQKPYKREDILKIYIYCYINRIRSSRRMETETKRNIELMWLVKKICPDHGTLSAFMKNNKASIKKLFKEFILFIKGLGLIDGSLLAIDGTKLKANSAKSRHFNDNIIKKKVEYYESKINQYIDEFINYTIDESQKLVLTEKVETYKERINQLNILKMEMKKQGKSQICLTDPDAKSMKNNGKFEVCYNMQTIVDSKYKFIVDFEVTNDVNDQGQLSNMSSKAKEIFSDNDKISLVADTGYYNMKEIVNTADEKTEVLIKRQKEKKSKIENGFDRTKFIFNKLEDTYLCPLGYTVPFKWNSREDGKDYKRYICTDYLNCGKKELCTSSKSGRSISRFSDEDIIEKINEITLKKNDIYKRRGSIVEHPFGTIKRHFGYTYLLTRGLPSVNAEGSLIWLAYNFKRLINILGTIKLVELFR